MEVTGVANLIIHLSCGHSATECPGASNVQGTGCAEYWGGGRAYALLVSGVCELDNIQVQIKREWITCGRNREESPGPDGRVPGLVGEAGKISVRTFPRRPEEWREGDSLEKNL